MREVEQEKVRIEYDALILTNGAWPPLASMSAPTPPVDKPAARLEHIKASYIFLATSDSLNCSFILVF